jgi:hypothetical protein
LLSSTVASCRCDATQIACPAQHADENDKNAALKHQNERTNEMLTGSSGRAACTNRCNDTKRMMRSHTGQRDSGPRLVRTNEPTERVQEAAASRSGDNSLREQNRQPEGEDVEAALLRQRAQEDLPARFSTARKQLNNCWWSRAKRSEPRGRLRVRAWPRNTHTAQRDRRKQCQGAAKHSIDAAKQHAYRVSVVLRIAPPATNNKRDNNKGGSA